MSSSNLQQYVLICDKKKRKKFLELLVAYDGVCIQTSYAKGSASAGTFATTLGFEPEEHKVVLSALMPTAKAQELTEVLKIQYNFKSANTGFAFSIPVHSLSL